MRAPRAPRKKLLVEGQDDLRIIPHLMEANGVAWEDHSGAPAVTIESTNGFTEMTKPGLLATELKASNLETLGIMADANDSAQSRWDRLRNLLVSDYPAIPLQPSSDGLVLDVDNRPRLGIWLMPDNVSRGMMETFLMYLVPDQNDPLLKHAEASRDDAKALGAPFVDAHADKALIHTWLAWQNPPGRQLHRAVLEKILDPVSPHGRVFVDWFRRLFEV